MFDHILLTNPLFIGSSFVGFSFLSLTFWRYAEKTRNVLPLSQKIYTHLEEYSSYETEFYYKPDKHWISLTWHNNRLKFYHNKTINRLTESKTEETYCAGYKGHRAALYLFKTSLTHTENQAYIAPHLYHLLHYIDPHIHIYAQHYHQKNTSNRSYTLTLKRPYTKPLSDHKTHHQ